MDWPSLITGGASTAAFFGLAGFLGKVWANRILEKDRTKSETQKQTVLHDLHKRGDKELFVHRLQFEKEFEVYLDLWRTALQVARAGIPFRIIASVPKEPLDEPVTKLRQAFNAFQRVVYDYKPFYVPRVYDSAKLLLDELFEVHLAAGALSNYGTANNQDKIYEKISEMDDIMQAVNDKYLPELCEAIRARMFPSASDETAE